MALTAETPNQQRLVWEVRPKRSERSYRTTLASAQEIGFADRVSIPNIPTLWQNAWRFLGELSEPRARQVALGLWVVLIATVMIVVAVDPTRRSATYEYQEASTRWWGGEQSLYKGRNNYLYLPQAAIIYTPFNVLPQRVGEPLWRLVCLTSLALALWTAARHLAPTRTWQIFLIATLLTLPSALASARNGQVNMPLAALYLLVAIALGRERWQLAAILLALSLALKPISIVPILLCGALYPRLILPLILWLAVMFAAAFLHRDPSYVSWQYEAFWGKLTRASKPDGNTWCDFAGILRSVGIWLPDKILLLIRTAAAGGTFLIGLFAVLRTEDKLRRALTVGLLSVVYLMVFNPRTETNSYVILGIWVGLLAAWEGLCCQRLKPAAVWAGVAILLGVENYGYPIFPLTDHWLKPLVALGIGAWLTRNVFRLKPGQAAIFNREEPDPARA